MSIRDTLNILSKLNFTRLWNMLLMQKSYYLSLLFKRPVVWGKPFSISIEPTTSCNLRCPECPSGLRKFSRNTGMLNFDLYKKIVDEIGSKLVYMILYFQGEPFLNPSFFEIVKDAHQRKIYTATSTNAHFLTEENARKTVESGLDRIIVSLDGIGQDTYAAYRVGGRYKRVIDGIETLVKTKKELKSKTPHIILQFIVFATNEHQIEEVKALSKKLGVDELQLKSAQVYEYENGNPLIPKNEKYSRYRQRRDGKWEIKNDFPNKCYRMSVSCVITWDGLVVPCCFDKDAIHQMGDLKKDSFDTVWKNPEYQKFRTRVITKRKAIDICRNCTEGMRL
ncbi:MAG: radical SAM protein [Bacteroidales bacterium]|nr:radical SAM protein [Bacteroidales bacterium]MCF8405586.1 radical SAM protein [Bacteroidales bacterium]